VQSSASDAAYQKGEKQLLPEVDQRVPVLIVGGGLAGLTTAMLLAWRGIQVMLVERHADTSVHPRARGVHLRSMELLRVAGLEQELLAADGEAFDNGVTIAIGESVMAPEFRTIASGRPFDTRDISPATYSRAGQDRVERILRRRAAQLGADIRFFTELVSFGDDGNGILAVVRDRKSQALTRVRADYMVAADGHNGRIRAALGIGTHGHGTLSHNVSILFEADLSHINKSRGFTLYYLQNPKFTGMFVNTDVANRASISLEYDPAKESAADYTVERCVALVRAALGIKNIEVKILSVSPWEAYSWVADRFMLGRVLLIGDAVHTMPPTGGLGGQTAIQDGYDVAWKLALVIEGHGDAALLATYETERKPVAELTVTRQTANYIERMRPDRTDLNSSKIDVDIVHVAMGYRYRSPAILLEEPDDGALTEDPYLPTGRPGTRAPHVVFERDGKPLSILDLIGPTFLMVAGPDADAWARSAAEVSEKIHVPVVVYRIGYDLIDKENRWTSRYGVSPSGCVLLRPDGYIAWRSRGPQNSQETILEDVLNRVSCRTRIQT
jgi:aklavinone 12-hydroxylase